MPSPEIYHDWKAIGETEDDISTWREMFPMQAETRQYAEGLGSFEVRDER